MKAGPDFWQRWPNGSIGGKGFVLAAGMATAAVICFGFLTWKELRLWNGRERERRHVLALAERSTFKAGLAYHKKGMASDRRGELEEAVGYYRQALQINPDLEEAHNNLGVDLADRGQLEEAMGHFRHALRINPDFAKAHYNLAVALAMRGELRGAIDEFRQALRIDPEYAAAHDSLGRALAQQGKREEAVQHFQEALRIMKSRRAVGPAK